MNNQISSWSWTSRSSFEFDGASKYARVYINNSNGSSESDTALVRRADFNIEQQILRKQLPERGQGYSALLFCINAGGHFATSIQLRGLFIGWKVVCLFCERCADQERFLVMSFEASASRHLRDRSHSSTSRLATEYSASRNWQCLESQLHDLKLVSVDNISLYGSD